MRFSILPALAASLVKLVSAEDLLFVDTLQYVEYKEATTKLGYTAKVVTEAEWRAMTTADFAKYKAIILSDPNCVGSPTPIKFVEDTKAIWSPAIRGNMILIGTDPTLHSGAQPGAVTLIDNSVRFAASGSETGLYFSLSCYWSNTESATVDALSEFGSFKVRGRLNCYNDAHIVASSEAMTSLDDKALSDWSCSVHEAFSEYPTSGVGGFQALAIAKDILGVGSQSFGDGTNGLPYIISRGATPAGCGNSIYEPKFNEECDHGSSNGATSDLCDKSCKCLYGVLDAAAGTCKPAPPVSSGTPGGPYHNATISVPYPVGSPTPSSTPCGASIIGIEIIKIIEIVEVCPEGSTVTTTVTTCLSTLQRPIYATTTKGYPCYACVLDKPSPTDFITVITETCPGTPNPTPTVTYKMCSSCSEKTLTTDSIPGCTPTATSCHGCASYVVETPHEHGQSAPVTTAVPYTTAAPTLVTGKVPVTPTTAKTYYTAGAGKLNVGVVGGLVAAVVAAL